MTLLSKAQVADVLEKAADRLELCPWGQRSERINEQKICAEDAIFLTLADANQDAIITATNRFHGETWDGFAQVHRVLSPYLPLKADMAPTGFTYDREQSLFEWNDHPGRTKDEVVELFKTVAKELRNEAAPE
jgi:hypothetical protein